eukprot:gene16346-16523_t
MWRGHLAASQPFRFPNRPNVVDNQLESQIRAREIVLWSREVVALLFRDAFRIALAFAIPVLVAMALILVLPKKYQVTAKLLVSVSNATTSLVTEGNGPLVTADQVVNSEVEVLKSQDLAIRTIEASSGQVGSAPRTPTDRQVKDFQSDISVAAVPASNVIKVSYRAESQAEAVRILKIFLKFYTEARDRDAIRSNLDFIHREIASLEAESASIDEDVARVKVEMGVFDPEVEKKTLLESKSALLGNVMQMRANAGQLRAKVASLQSTLRTTPMVIQAYPDTEESDASAQARARLLELREQQAKMAANYQPDSHAMKDLQAQIDMTLAFINAESARFSQITPEERHAASLESQSGTLEQKLKRIETTENRLAPLLRRKASAAARLDTLRLKETGLQLGKGGMPSVSLIESPEIQKDAKPAWPNKILFLLGGLFAGLACAATTIAISFALKNTFLVPEAVERFANVPVLVSLPIRETGTGRR